MNRTIGGIPLLYWVLGIGGGIAVFAWIKKKGGAAAASPGTTGKTGQQSFTQAQEVQDFQIFSALTGAQQASDLNFLSEVAGLFSGGSSTATTPGGAGGSGGGGGSTVPSPPSTGTAPPATVPASNPKAPGYGLVPTAQGQMVFLGVNQAGSPVYNVSGGAPVYFGNAQGLATGSQYEQPGQDIYTPAAYAGQVASNAIPLGAPYT